MKLTIHPFDKQRPIVLTLSLKRQPAQEAASPNSRQPVPEIAAAADQAGSGLAESLFTLTRVVLAGDYHPAALE